MNRKTPKEVIEKEISGFKEEAYIKYPKEELIKVPNLYAEKRGVVKLDWDFIDSIEKEKGKNYFSMHTHPSRNWFMEGLPSEEDLIALVYRQFNKHGKGEIIVQKDAKTGKIQGYTFIKCEKEMNYEHSGEDITKIHRFGDMEDNVLENKETSENVVKGVEKLCEEIGLKIRFVPEKGYFFNRKTGNYEKGNSIEKKIYLIFIGLFFALSLFFSYPKILGFFFLNNSFIFDIISLLFGAGFFIFIALFVGNSLTKELLLNKWRIT